MGNLYILATPIGNINEANDLLRMKLETLKILFCEDTRITKNLLKLLHIKNTPELISFHKFSENDRVNEAIELLKKTDCGLISDAGYPLISDPGFGLVKACHEQNIKIYVVNGSCAINHAIVQSGFCSTGFIFIGFLEKTKKAIIQQITPYVNLNLPVVCYVSVHTINQTITWLQELYPNTNVYIGRELSKLYEQYYVGPIKLAPQQTTKGEFCMIINFVSSQTSNNQEQTISHEQLKELQTLVEQYHMKLKDACKYLSSKANLDKHLLYELYIKSKK